MTGKNWIFKKSVYIKLVWAGIGALFSTEQIQSKRIVNTANEILHEGKGTYSLFFLGGGGGLKIRSCIVWFSQKNYINLNNQKNEKISLKKLGLIWEITASGATEVKKKVDNLVVGRGEDVKTEFLERSASASQSCSSMTSAGAAR